DRFDSPLPGWNSHAHPFGMEPEYRARAGVGRARVGTPDILSLLALDAALEVWAGVDLRAIRTKSLGLTEFFLRCIDELDLGGAVRSVTPEPARRGSQVVLCCDGAEQVMKALIAGDVI